MVAQVDEQHAAMVADTMHPAGEADMGADIGLAKGGASVTAVTVHRSFLELSKCRARKTIASGGVEIARKSA
jgi:hypothetical protein